MPSLAQRRLPRAFLVVLLSIVLVVLVALLALQLAGGSTTSSVPVTGTGDPLAQDRTAGSFTAISASGAITVVVAVGPTRQVTLTAQRNLLPMIHTDVVDGRLVVTIDAPGFTSSQPVAVRVTTPVLTRVSLDGGANGTMELDTDTLNVTLAGASSLSAIGRAGQLVLAEDGESTADLVELKADTATVTITGTSSATINAATSLTGTADSASTIKLAQQPKTLSVRTSGGATVTGP